MTFFILRLAKVLCGFALRPIAAWAVCIGSAAYSAYALGHPLLLGLPCKLCLLGVLAGTFKVRSAGQWGRAALCVLGGTMLLGGISYYVFGVLYGGVLYASQQLRVTLIVSLIAIYIPALIKKAFKTTPAYVHLLVQTQFGSKNLRAKVDTGNTATGLDGTRVLFCNACEALFGEAPPSAQNPAQGMMPIAYHTIDASRITFGIAGNVTYYAPSGEKQIRCLIAPAERPFTGFEALLFDAKEIYQ